MTAEDVDRFEREVRVTATLSHPNTIAIYDYGRTAEGAFYYAMEFLEGIDLDSLVTNFGPLPEARVIHLLRQACGALGEGHEAGVVHRDVKLANLYLCSRGGIPDVLKVLDFGLVKTAEALRVTRASVVVGTPENMAPELFESAASASPLSDIYALGCVGYALLTGHRPFAGSSLAELCNAHLGKPVAPPSQRLGRPVDPTLERVVLACLAKRTAERPRVHPRDRRAAGALAARRLLDARPGGRVLDSPPRPHRRRRRSPRPARRRGRRPGVGRKRLVHRLARLGRLAEAGQGALQTGGRLFVGARLAVGVLERAGPGTPTDALEPS